METFKAPTKALKRHEVAFAIGGGAAGPVTGGGG